MKEINCPYCLKIYKIKKYFRDHIINKHPINVKGNIFLRETKNGYILLFQSNLEKFFHID